MAHVFFFWGAAEQCAASASTQTSLVETQADFSCLGLPPQCRVLCLKKCRRMPTSELVRYSGPKSSRAGRELNQLKSDSSSFGSGQEDWITRKRKGLLPSVLSNEFLSSLPFWKVVFLYWRNMQLYLVLHLPLPRPQWGKIYWVQFSPFSPSLKGNDTNWGLELAANTFCISIYNF